MITVGLPFYNNKSTLMDAVRSVFAQSTKDWELILVDDGSTDGSLQIAQEIDDPRVRIYSDGINRGLSVRLNQIAQLARGEYLARMDGDDFMHPQRLAREANLLDNNPQVDITGTAMYSIDIGGSPRGVRAVQTPDGSDAGVLRRVILPHATLMGRTEWFRKHRYDESCRRAEDHDLYLRHLRDLRFRHLPEPLYFVREEQAGCAKKYVDTCKDECRIYLAYGPQLVGPWKTATLCMLTVVKGAIYRAFGLLGAERLLVRRRNISLTPTQVSEAAAVLDQIRSTAVPGLSSRTADSLAVQLA